MYLKMIVLLRGVDLVPSLQIELGVQRVVRTLLGLERVEQVGLLHPARQDAAQAQHGGLAEFVALAAVVVNASGTHKAIKTTILYHVTF